MTVTPTPSGAASSLTPSSQVILRNAALLSGDLLLVRSPQDQLSQQLDQTIDVLHLESGLPYNKCRNSVTLGEMPADRQYEFAIIFLPREKALLRFLVEQVAGAAKKIWVVGPKDHGIAGAKKVLEQYGQVNQLDVARHCRLFQIDATDVSTHPLDHYEVSATASITSVTGDNIDLQLKSLPGVFSHGELDAGTRLLLETLPSQRGNVLDFGSGCGVISAFIGKSTNSANDLTLHAIDNSTMAVQATQRTLAANELSGEVSNGHSLDQYIAQGMKFDNIISNPPFHAGKKDTDFSAVRTLIEQAPRCLRFKGSLIVVANAFLPYQNLLEANFAEVSILADNRKFRVYQAKGLRKRRD